MFTEEEQEAFRTGNMVKGFCDCGALVWECPSKRFLPRYEEVIICPKCGKDCSRKAPLTYKIKTRMRNIKRKIVLKVLR